MARVEVEAVDMAVVAGRTSVARVEVEAVDMAVVAGRTRASIR